ncbi:MAG: hypothetical protein U9R68_02650 [Planctomycetota bacterium]|nr:hypothetical protein [Planctomycetota bacterium]
MQHEAGEPLVLRPMRPGSGDDPPRMYQVQIVRLRHRLRPDAPLEDTWRLLGTTGVPHEKRALWEANDLRLGEGGRLAAQRLQELIRETPDRTARFNRLVIPENTDFVIESGGTRTGLDVLWTDAEGRLAGRHFDRASPRFRLVCRPPPDDPQAVCIALVPEIAYGDPRFRYERTETGFTRRMAPETFTVRDLAAEMRLAPGRMLVLGARRSSDVSLGGAFCFERRGPDLWKQTLLVSARPLPPGTAPEPDETKAPDAAEPRP